MAYKPTSQRQIAAYKKAKKAEYYETPEWAVKAVLEVESLTRRVVDPCCGNGVLGLAAMALNHEVIMFDKYDWNESPYHRWQKLDFFDEVNTRRYLESGQVTILMNPPFSLADKFVERCLKLDVKKIICFQRFAWWESEGRREFWDKNPPSRVLICGNRATCWRHDIPMEHRTSSSTTAHAWFIWERGAPPGTLLGRIYKV